MTDTPGDIQRILGIMARLRDPQRGCPWDLEQDFASIAAYTIDEAYEVADAIDRGDLPGLCDELGDLLLQVVFHAQMAQEQGAFGFGDVVDAISDKMIRRHPHIFGDAAAGDAEAVLRNWDAIKRDERAAAGDTDTSALAGIARGLPEWQRAVKLQARAARVGFDWPGPAPVIDKLHEEIEEVRVEFDAVAADPDDAAAQDRLEEELGDLLFVAANLARHAKVDVGAALRRANHKFERRFRAMEAIADADGQALAGQSLDAQDGYWNRAKQAERTP
ncbi:nucleoside triphosphate pyrophosphohydrolase [Lysobacteraceae bacterium NML93-0792]|nr:nucleoside triphosphate pyrophosphohydrolase [Xanthomonadaceae bacterium NML93-0792]PBS17191.1 nucleoside triphosphate pyrophosphohydrolase [Xanthomonadaceae bacterium NML93-0793]PBS19554.1 nucleoside triphosphate pyrophosphohydrolase [Xanthomonadaceae bacterium NML93-0831]